MYVSVGEENRLALYQMNPETGALTPTGSVELEGSPGSLAVDPQQKFLYVALRSARKVATFAIDPESGGLTLLATTPVVDDPVYVSTDRTGKFLLTAYFGGNKAATYPIANDGTVDGEVIQVLNAPRNPHSIQVDRSNRFAFLPNTGADLIQQFQFDASSGKLTPNVVAKVTTATGAGPRHFFFHPQMKDIVYFINEKNSSVTTYRMDPATGQLTALGTVPTLPAGFHGANTCADVEVTPSGKYLYGSNRGHDSIAGFSIDESGLLTPIGHAATEKMPREFNIDPTGRYLFSAGQDTNKMASYRINAENGRLTPLDVYEVGQGPAWVLIVKQPKE